MRLDDKLEYLFQNKPSVCLYHYTGMDGFLGILESKLLWASESRFLNDTAEIAYFFTSLVYHITSSGLHEGENGKLFQQFIDWTKIRNHSKSGFSPNLFITSFSENGNLLSQWRGYCPDGGGVSLGFKPESINEIATMNGSLLGRCIYEKEQLSDIASTILDIISAEAEEKTDSHPTQSYHASFANMELSLLKIAALFKHFAYEDECEWRLIIEPNNKQPSPGTKFRNKSGVLVPYNELSIKVKQHDELLIDNIYVGPSQSIENNFDSITQAFRAHNGTRKKQTLITNSGIPYRGI